MNLIMDTEGDAVDNTQDIIMSKPPRRWLRLLAQGTVLVVVLLVGIAIGAAAHTTTITKVVHAAAAPSSSAFAQDPNGSTCAALDSQGYCPGNDPTASPSSDDLTGPVGTSYSVTSDSGPNDSTTTYNVTLDKVTQHAHLGQYSDLTNGSDHVTAAKFTITGTSGSTQDDSDNDAVAVGTDGQDYNATFDEITEGTNFNGGDFNVSPNQSVTGWVIFELPPGVSIASIQWSPGSGPTATWTVT